MVVTAPSNTLNINQVYQLLLNNGANQNEAATLAGISVWEAGGGNPNSINPQALNPNWQPPPIGTNDYSVGLFQYNFAPGAGNFNYSNPMLSTRGGFSAQQLMGDVNAQAQAALALLRGSASGFGNWTTYRAHLGSIQQFVQQLIGGSQVPIPLPPMPGPIPLPGQGQPPTQVNPSAPIQGETGVQATVGANIKPTGFNLGLADSIAHVGFQFLLVLLAIALLLGGIYLLGTSGGGGMIKAMVRGGK